MLLFYKEMQELDYLLKLFFKFKWKQCEKAGTWSVIYQVNTENMCLHFNALIQQ